MWVSIKNFDELIDWLCCISLPNNPPFFARYIFFYADYRLLALEIFEPDRF